MSAKGQEDDYRRVVITGVGALSPAGIGVEALWDKVINRTCCIDYITRFDTTNFPVTYAGEIPGYEEFKKTYFSRREQRHFARFVQYAVIAADEAMAQAGIEKVEDPDSFACVFGGGTGGAMELYEQQTENLLQYGPERVSALFVPMMISNMAAGNLSMRYNLRGDCTNQITACATGTHNIGSAYRLIKHGYADAALAGSSEETITRILMAGFFNLGTLSESEDPKHAVMPFDKRRSGFVPSEGAGAMVIESLEHARTRGARPIAEITGFAASGDAYHTTAPNPNGETVARTMRQALEQGGFTPDDLGHLNAHGTSTVPNEIAESAALHLLCGARTPKVPVFAAKGSLGHMLSAAGAVEAILCALAVSRNTVPPTAGFEEPDPDCPAHVLTEALTNYPQKVALSNSMGFGGHNGALAIAPFSG